MACRRIRGFESLRLHPSRSRAHGGFTLGGLVAGEGCFTTVRQRWPHRDGSPRLKFVFCMTMARRDLHLLEALRSFLGYGSIQHHKRGRAQWQPTSMLRIHSIWAHRNATIPFAEAFLLPCAKRRQYEEWRDHLIAYDLARPNRYGKGRHRARSLDAKGPYADGCCAEVITTGY